MKGSDELKIRRMKRSSELKTTREYYKDAFKTLKGPLPMVWLICCVLQIFTFVAEITMGSILAIVIGFIMIFFQYGITRYGLSLVRNKENAQVGDVFSWVNCIGRVFVLAILLTIIEIFIGLISISITLVFGGLITFLFTSFITEATLGILISAIVLISQLILSVFIFMSMYNLAGDDMLSAGEAVIKGFEMGQDYTKNIVLFIILTAVLILIAMLISMGVGLIFGVVAERLVSIITVALVMSYRGVAGAHLYLDITGESVEPVLNM